MEAGFVDIRVTEYVIPITVAERSAGKIWLISCLDALEANCLRLLTAYMGWDPEKCKAACEAAAREMANLAKNPEKSKGLQVKMRVIVARKPLDAPPSEMPPSPFESAGSPSSEMVVDEGSPDPTLRAADEEGLESELPAKDVNINGQAPTSPSASTATMEGVEAVQPGSAL